MFTWLRSWWAGRRSRSKRSNAYAGANVDRLMNDYVRAPIRSADQDIKGGAIRLRARARELERNNPHAVQFLGLLEDNVIGPDGIRLQARVKNRNGDTDKRTNETIEREWTRWGQVGNCTADRKMSWHDVQCAVIRNIARDGEALVRFLPGFENRHAFALQVLDVDLLDFDFIQEAKDGQNEVRMGVEIDKWGAPVAYHLFTRHPSETRSHERRERIRVPARDIAHLYMGNGRGQTRGVTWFASVIVQTHMLQGYQEAELVAARTAASKMGFYKLTNPEAMPDPENLAGQQGELIEDAEPGSFHELPFGYEFEAWDPNHPSTAYPEFMKASLRAISAGLRRSYATLSGDLEGVNYSSTRWGAIAERDVDKRLQQFLISHFHRRVYLRWFDQAQLAGALDLPFRNMERQRDHVWMPRGFAWVDPLKDIQAEERAIALGLNSRTRLAAARGHDHEEILDELAREAEMAAEKGVQITGGTNEQQATGNAESDPDEDPDDESRSDPFAGFRRNGRANPSRALV